MSGLKDIRNVFTTFWGVFLAKVHDFCKISYTLKLSLYFFFHPQVSPVDTNKCHSYFKLMLQLPGILDHHHLCGVS